jgi:hypothetical protein
MDDGLRSVLEMLDPLTRDTLRRILIHDQADREAISPPNLQAVRVAADVRVA